MIDPQHKKRANLAALRACQAATLLAFGAIWITFSYGLLVSSISSFVFFLACSLALILWYRSPTQERFYWELPYFSFYLITFPVHFETGGLWSPTLPLTVVIIFACGILLQAQYSLKMAIGAAGFYLAVWIALAFFGVETGKVVTEPFLASLLVCIYTAAIVACILAFRRSTIELSIQTQKKSEEIREITQKLYQAGKMTEMGDLVASTAHEFSQPVQTISVGSTLIGRILSEKVPDIEKVKTLQSKISISSERLVKLIDQMKRFSRNDPHQSERFDLRDAVRSIVQLVNHNLETRNVQFTVHLPEEAIWIEADPLQLQQVLLNLINNARDASVVHGRPYIQIEVGKTAKYGRIKIQNNGAAISVETQSKLFHSYITTKPKGHGTGLGLRICHKLIEENHGRIFFCSDQECTVFVIDFPTKNSAAGPGLTRTNENATDLIQASGKIFS